MSATTFEGVVEQGRIKLDADVRLPEGAKVYVVVPGVEMEAERVHVYSPRLAHPEQAADFELEIVQS